MRIFKNAWFARFARRERISTQALLDAIARAGQGQIDADLGGGVIKQRISRPHEGKSKGYRSIIFFRKGRRAFFVYGFAKNAMANIDENEEALFKKMAGHVLGLTDAQLQLLLANKQFEEIVDEI